MIGGDASAGHRLCSFGTRQWDRPEITNAGPLKGQGHVGIDPDTESVCWMGSREFRADVSAERNATLYWLSTFMSSRGWPVRDAAG